jgi:exodeoxyribonuclease VII small subunit
MNRQKIETSASALAAADPGSPGAPLPENFEAAVAELESLVQAMESGSLALEQSLEAYRRGAQLAAHCRQLLADVQQQVRVLEADLLKPFDTGSETD